MFWASKRQTTKIEDRAYSLLGLFNISLPIMYGEGSRAFRRLQEEIIRSIFDHTILAWRLEEEGKTYSGLLADSPDAFAQSGSIRKMPFDKYSLTFDFGEGRMDYSLTNAGVKITLPYQKVYGHLSVVAACIACIYAETGAAVVIFLRHLDRPSNHFFRTKTSSGSLYTPDELVNSALCWINRNNEFNVVEPERFLGTRSILSLIPNDIATQNIDISPRDIKCYQVTLFITAGRISTVDPMPHSGGLSRITFETEAELVWMATIDYRDKSIFKIFLAVVDHRLKYHLESLFECEPVKAANLLTGADEGTDSIDENMFFRCEDGNEEDFNEDSEDSNDDDDDDDDDDKINIINYPFDDKRKWSCKSFSDRPCRRLNLGIDKNGLAVAMDNVDELVANTQRVNTAIGANPNRILYNIDIDVSSERERQDIRDSVEANKQRIDENAMRMTEDGGMGNEADDRSAIQSELNERVFKPTVEKALQEGIIDDIEKRFSEEINKFLNNIDRTIDGHLWAEESGHENEPPAAADDDGKHLSYLPPPGSDFKPNWCFNADINFTADKRCDDHGRPFSEAAIVQYIYDNFDIVCDSVTFTAKQPTTTTTTTTTTTSSTASSSGSDGSELAKMSRTIFYIVPIDGEYRLFRTCL